MRQGSRQGRRAAAATGGATGAHQAWRGLRACQPAPRYRCPARGATAPSRPDRRHGARSRDAGHHGAGTIARALHSAPAGPRPECRFRAWARASARFDAPCHDRTSSYGPAGPRPRLRGAGHDQRSGLRLRRPAVGPRSAPAEPGPCCRHRPRRQRPSAGQLRTVPAAASARRMSDR